MRAVGLAALAVLALAGTAQARGTISYDGTTMTFTGDGGTDNVSVGPSQGELAWTTSGLDAVPPQCTTDPYVDSTAYCPWPQRIVVQLGAGDDRFSISDAPWDPFPGGVRVESHGGDGDDRLQSGHVLDGGAGNDRLEGHDGDQLLHGGPGDDEVNGLAGSDQVYGDAGNDTVSGDAHRAAFPDVIDGGPGVDTIGQDWQGSEATLTITLSGSADDGRPGEGDDVRGVERLKGFSAGRFVGTDGADSIEVVQTEQPSELSGLGGDDVLDASDGADRLDGGSGADRLDGGFGDDTLVGGPGRDAISGDSAQGECALWQCRLPSGNDTVEARDGEVDSVTCGVGADTVRADPQDVVAPDCETVERGGHGPGPRVDDPSGRVGRRCVVPRLRGLTVRQATGRLRRAGCRAQVRRVAHRRVRAGRVAAQGARAGKRLAAGATVKVSVSRGPR